MFATYSLKFGVKHHDLGKKRFSSLQASLQWWIWITIMPEQKSGPGLSLFEKTHGHCLARHRVWVHRINQVHTSLPNQSLIGQS